MFNTHVVWCDLKLHTIRVMNDNWLVYQAINEKKEADRQAKAHTGLVKQVKSGTSHSCIEYLVNVWWLVLVATSTDLCHLLHISFLQQLKLKQNFSLEKCKFYIFGFFSSFLYPWWFCTNVFVLWWHVETV